MVSSLTLPRHPLFDAIATHDPNATAVVHCTSGRTFRYGELLGDVARAKTKLYAAAGKTDLNGERVAFLVENGYDYVGMRLLVPFESTRACELIWLGWPLPTKLHTLA